MLLSTRVLIPAADRSLVSLAVLKGQLGIAASDGSQNTTLTRYIAQATAEIERHCGCVFAVETVSDTFRFTACDIGLQELSLSRYPVVNIETLETASDATEGATVLLFDLGGAVASEIIPLSYIVAPPVVDVPILRHTLSADAAFAINLPGSVMTAGVAPTADTTFDLAINGLFFATVTILAGENDGTFLGNAASAVAGDVFTIIPRASSASTGLTADPTLGMISGYIVSGDPGPQTAYGGLVPISYIVTPPSVDTPILRYTMTAPTRFKADLPGSLLTAGVAATAEVVFDIEINGSAFATATIGAGGTDAVFDGIETSALANDIITITPRAGEGTDLLVDPTLGMLSGYLVGSPAVDIPAAGQPVSGEGIAPGSTVVSVAGNSVTLNLPIVDDILAGSDVTFGIAIYQVSSTGVATGLIYDIDYILDTNYGIVSRTGSGYPVRWWGPTQTVVMYAGGYDPIPADLQAEAMRLISGFHHGQGRDPLLKSRDGPTYGREEFWVGTAPFGGRLDRYVRKVLAW